MRLPLLPAVLVVAACAPGGGQPTSPVAPPGEMGEVLVVTDGDTLRVRLAGAELEIRLAGVNAPESGECFADRSRAMLASAAGAEVTVVPTPTERDQYGRMLAYVSAQGVNLNRLMLREGAAIATSGEHPLLTEFLDDEAAAFGGGRGMWARGVCRPSDDPGVYIHDLSPDAPGRDEDDPNGEIIVLASGDRAVDLTGWVLRDESSVHRLRFPAGSVIAAGALLTIHSGCGPDRAGVVHWCAGGAVWNNDGDTALLLDAAGLIVDRWRYGAGR